MDFPQTAPEWRQAIEEKANELQVQLAAVPHWGNCPVCEKPYPDSLGSHIAGKDHYKKLWWRVGDAPRQEWRTSSGGVITFDHVSGEIAFVDLQAQSAPSWALSSRPYAEAGPADPMPPADRAPAPFLEREVDVEAQLPSQGPVAPPAREPAADRAPAPFLEREAPREEAAARRPSAAQLDDLWSRGQLYCDSCASIRPSADFHKSQQKYSLESRRCISCIDRAHLESSFLRCIQCQQSLSREAFAKSMRSSEEPICRACKEVLDIEKSKLTCLLCGQSLNRSEFRKKVDWEAPKCASCLSLKEKRDYEQFQRDREDEAARQAELREKMGEEQLRDNFQLRILDRMPLIKLQAYEIFQEERKMWASRLMQNILNLKDLSDQWRFETPSRDHSLDREEAERFKQLEDSGDRLFKELAYSFFADFVMNEEEETMASALLAHRAECRHHSLFLRGRVVACIKAVGDDARRLAGSPLLDVKYQEGWKQISANEKHVLNGLNMQLKVKTYPAALWQDIKEDLYDDDDDRGSHNKILSRLLSMAGGTSEGSNRTETLNFCADLLGFQSPDDVKYKIWEEHFLDCLPGVQRVPIQYGSGKQFKLDKSWATKKEANCLEALMGALDQAGHNQLCQALATLAALCHLAPADVKSLMPSNWSMAEKVLANSEQMAANPAIFGGDLFLRKLAGRHLDQKRLQMQMDLWLGRKGNKMSAGSAG